MFTPRHIMFFDSFSSTHAEDNCSCNSNNEDESDKNSHNDKCLLFFLIFSNQYFRFIWGHNHSSCATCIILVQCVSCVKNGGTITLTGFIIRTTVRVGIVSRLNPVWGTRKRDNTKLINGRANLASRPMETHEYAGF